MRAPRHVWSPEELQLLTELYPDMLTSKIAAQLGVSLVQAYSKAAKLGLKKSEAFRASPESCRLRRGDNVGAATRFKPGNQTWNAGMKGLDMGPRSHATRFKKGERRGAAARNWVPIGSERITDDGYLQRKLTDTGYPPRDWVAVHIIVWTEHHGPVPKGCTVTFKDGNRANVDIANLELLTRRELMARNTVHNYPPELRKVIRLKAVLTRKINQRGGGNEQREHD